MSAFWRRRNDQQQSYHNSDQIPLSEEVVSQLQLAEKWYQSANTLPKQGKYEEAIVQYRKAIAVFEKEEPEGSKLCQSYYYLGTCHRHIGLYDESIEYYEKSLRSKVKTKSNHFLCACHYSKATSLRCSGKYNQAAVHYQKAIDICERTSPGSGSTVLALSFVGLATFHCGIGEFRQAEDLFERAFAILACFDPKTEANGSANYHHGMFCAEKEEWDRAFENFEIANRCYLHNGNMEGIAACQREMAMILVQQNRSNKSTEALLDQALMTQLFNGKRQTVELASTYTARGVLHLARSEYNKAHLSFQESEKILALKAPRSFEFAKMCTAMAQLLLAQRDVAAAVGRYGQALSVYDHYHSTSPMRERIAAKIKALEFEIATDSEVRTGIRTAIATPLDVSIRNASRNPWFQDQAVIAMPADLCSLVSDYPLAGEIFREHENFQDPLQNDSLDGLRAARPSMSANFSPGELQAPFNEEPLPQFKDQVREKLPPFPSNVTATKDYLQQFKNQVHGVHPGSSRSIPLASQRCDATPHDVHLRSSIPNGTASHGSDAAPAPFPGSPTNLFSEISSKPVSPRSVMGPPLTDATDEMKPAAVKVPKLSVLVIAEANDANYVDQMNLSNDNRLAFMATDLVSGELDLQAVEAINPNIIVTNLGIIQVSVTENDLQHDLPQGLKLIKCLRRNGKVTPIILFAATPDEEQFFKNETMRLGGNGIVSDARSLHDILLKFRNDLLS
jgi:tetratricopeptide (TPR) repeat protein